MGARRFFLSYLISFLVLSFLFAMPAKRVITPEDIVMIKSVSSPQIAPDGKHIAFVVTEVDTNNLEHFRNSDIWIVPADLSEQPRKYAFGVENETMPRWSPDGKYLAFLSNRDGKKNQIYLLRTDGGEALPITSHGGGVTDFIWFKDSKTIFFTAKDSIDSEKEKRKEKKDDETVVDEEFLFNRLYEVNIETKEVKLITSFDENVNDFDVSPDGSLIAMSVSSTPNLDDIYRNSKLVLIERDGTGKKVLSDECFGNVRWSPDGKKILFMVPVGKKIASLPCLYFLASGNKKLLLQNYSGTIGYMEWLPDGKLILASSMEGTHKCLVKINISTGEVKRIKALKYPNFGGSIFSYCSRKPGYIAYLDADYNSPPDVWIMKSNGSSSKKLTAMNPQIDSLKFGKVKTITWNSTDGTKIEGVLVLPVDYKKGHKYPLVVHIHGGPKWAWWEGWICSWHEWAQFLANHGYAVLLPNPRGSDGYGWKFAEANYKDWGYGDLEDIKSGVKYLIEKGIADPDRVGIGGWSYGGYMTAWAVTQTDMFKAAVMGAGLSNLVSMYGTTDIPTFMRTYFAGFPYGREDEYMKHSALRFITNVTTPTLILHGQSDYRVPISQAYEFYRALKDLGVEVRFVIYPREPHGIREPLHQIDLMKKVLEWYDSHLK